MNRLFNTPEEIDAFLDEPYEEEGIKVPYEGIIKKAAETYNLDTDLLKAMIDTESGGNATAVSPKGASGLMQLMPTTAEELGVTDISDPEQNIMGGAKYIRQLIDRYDGNVTLALAAYNAGPGNVDKHGGVPDFPETQNYVKKVEERRTKSKTKTRVFNTPEEIDAFLDEPYEEESEKLRKRNTLSYQMPGGEQPITTPFRKEEPKNKEQLKKNLSYQMPGGEHPTAEVITKENYQEARPYIEFVLDSVGLVAGSTLLGIFGIFGGALGYTGSQHVMRMLDDVFKVKERETGTELVKELGKDAGTGLFIGSVGKGVSTLAKGVAGLSKNAGFSKKPVSIIEQASKKPVSIIEQASKKPVSIIEQASKKQNPLITLSKKLTPKTKLDLFTGETIKGGKNEVKTGKLLLSKGRRDNWITNVKKGKIKLSEKEKEKALNGFRKGIEAAGKAGRKGKDFDIQKAFTWFLKNKDMVEAVYHNNPKFLKQIEAIGKAMEKHLSKKETEQSSKSVAIFLGQALSGLPFSTTVGTKSLLAKTPVIGKYFLKYLEKKSTKQVENLMLRAMLNPEYAKVLEKLSIADNEIVAKAAIKKLETLIKGASNLGAYTGTTQTKEGLSKKLKQKKIYEQLKKGIR